MGGTICITKGRVHVFAKPKHKHIDVRPDTSAVCIQLDQDAENGVNILIWERNTTTLCWL